MKIIDTDVARSFQKTSHNQHLLAWLARNDPNDFAFTAATIAEIRYGQALLPAGDPHAARLDAWLRQLIAVANILPLDAAAADHLGRIWATPALKNFFLLQPGQKQLKTAGDLMIAAIALANNAPIVTGNATDFNQIAACFPSLQVENPFTPYR